jgi:hypothetical protein
MPTLVHDEVKLKRDESTSEARHLDSESLLDNAQRQHDHAAEQAGSIKQDLRLDIFLSPVRQWSLLSHSSISPIALRLLQKRSITTKSTKSSVSSTSTLNQDSTRSDKSVLVQALRSSLRHPLHKSEARSTSRASVSSSRHASLLMTPHHPIPPRALPVHFLAVSPQASSLDPSDLS